MKTSSMTAATKYERRKIADLKPDPNNPRTITAKARSALAASMKRFGLVQPIIVNSTTGHVVGGHQRLTVLREQGETEVDVIVGTWTADEERALNVALNNQAAQGTFTDVRDYLKDSLRALSLDDFQELRLDELLLDPKKREAKEGTKAARGLEYKLVIQCSDEEQQATLLEELEAKGLEVKVLII